MHEAFLQKRRKSFKLKISQSTPLSEFFSYFICHLQGFYIYYTVKQFITGLQIPLADGLQIKYLQALRRVEPADISVFVVTILFNLPDI